jgi:(1->4)-alpha-D-glucan 1-alpha-D-glucosylmutase
MSGAPQDAGALDALCARAGIERAYLDQFGAPHEASAETVRAIAAALGNDTAPSAAPAAAQPLPARAYLPAALESGPGIWGIAIQLYALRGARDWGIGDFGALADFAARAAAAGAGTVGLNPLHALHLDEPERASPYSPTSRRFLNPLYIDVEAVPELADCPAAQQLMRTDTFQAELARLRAAEMVDYRGVAALKLRALALLHASFAERHAGGETGRGRAFQMFRDTEGPALRRFAIFQALREERGGADPAQRAWRNWPAELRSPQSPAVAAFAAEHAPRIGFFEYLQWIAHEQLQACARAAAPMPVGLYRDLAVSVDPDSGEAWAEQEAIVSGFSIGAPPDAWNTMGQDWGLAPLNPLALRRQGFRPFADLLCANMKHAGALRIDHVLGLWRTFWIRHGDMPSEGAYVRYPFDELVAVLVAESQRARCIAIGEDLGTIPPGLREALARAGVLSYRLFYFEREGNIPYRPEHYPRQALIAVGTHDLPPLAAYWRGDDLTMRAELGFFPEPGRIAEERAQRDADRAALAGALRAEGLLGDGVPGAPPIAAAYCYLSRAPSRIVMVQIEDALGLTGQINVPGTPDAPPNWRRRLPLDTAAIFASAEAQALFAALNAERPPTP